MESFSNYYNIGELKKFRLIVTEKKKLKFKKIKCKI